MTKTYWDAMASDLNVLIVHPYQVGLANSTVTVVADAFFPCFGAEQGMLVFHDLSDLEEHEEILVREGFGYTCFRKMLAEEYSRKDAIEMLADWGWTDRLRTPPAWLASKSDGN